MTAPSSPPDPGARFVVLDVETTGLRANEHRILEIAAITTDRYGSVIDEWATRLNPQGPVGATHIHGIRDQDVAHAPTFDTVVPEVNRRLAGAAVVAHNAAFDLAFLRAEYRRAGWDLPVVPALCTLRASEYHLPHLDRRRLNDCCSAIGRPVQHAHSALGDARATAGLLAAFMHPTWGTPPLAEHVELPAVAARVVWPTTPTRAPQQGPLEPNRRRPPARVVAKRAVAAANPPSMLVEMVGRFSLVDALDEGAPEGSVAYLEKLAEVLEDGVITVEEAGDLAEVAAVHELGPEEVAAANKAFVLTLAHAALDDGKVSRAERSELLTVAELLDVDGKAVPRLLSQAEDARHHRLSVGLAPLPADWSLGEPLRVGDKVVFTGGADTVRDRLEADSEKLGVRVIGSVSAKTTMLVSDGDFAGTKAEKAAALGTRTVPYNEYAVMLAHLQPSGD